jgi:hypothetical protein
MDGKGMVSEEAEPTSSRTLVGSSGLLSLGPEYVLPLSNLYKKNRKAMNGKGVGGEELEPTPSKTLVGNSGLMTTDPEYVLPLSSIKTKKRKRSNREGRGDSDSEDDVHVSKREAHGRGLVEEYPDYVIPCVKKKKKNPTRKLGGKMTAKKMKYNKKKY